ncbi:RNA polymerase subunit sigma [Ammoniphilus oxalaticus]|uniref:RNA polymerase subunit sigma n=1 Tax=Ammoniphilus oxalaticus TaxID=66863 RepID=A0A419SJ34_9BACL|nr:RNA polymerase sigma factor [Ammoniphilus oxalaticus]RKD23977.1 RNA polymerase subunit sigma [Ammoniphilus oxalaticus]
MTEAELIRAAQTGDTDALIQLLREIENEIYRTAFYVLKNQQDAMDASQEALIRIYKNIKSYQAKAKFSTWTQRIVMNVCMDHFRRKRDAVSIDEHEFPLEDDANVEEEVQLSHMAKDIQDAINLLPSRQRQVVILRYLQDFSYAEISETLELPINTVKSHLFRARQQLKELLSDYEKGGVRV